MKICYVANSRFPSERAHMTQIVSMCNAFCALGHEVTLLVTDRPSSVSEDPEAFYGTQFLFRVERVVVPDIAGRAPTIPPALRPWLFMIQRVVFALRGSAIVARMHADVVYGRDEWVLALVSLFTRARVVWESHEARFTWASRALTRRGQRFVVISEGIRDAYVRQGVPAESMLVAHDAVDERFFLSHISKAAAQERLGIVADTPVVMYIGEFDTWKGVETLFAAAALSEGKYAVYVIGGRDPGELARLKELHPNVHFLGPQPYKDLPLNQQAADVLVIPNTGTNALSAEYTSPLKLFAHMTSKRPLVLSRIPSLTRVLAEDRAYYCAPDDPTDLAQTIAHVLSHADEARERAARACETSKTYTWRARAERILDVFHTTSERVSVSPQSYKRVLTYLVVGVLVALFQFVSFWFLMEVVTVPYLAASVTSFILTVFVSYLMQKHITFRGERSKTKKTSTTLAWYYGNALFGLAINTGIMFVGVDVLHGLPLVVQVVSIVVLASYNFIIYRLILT